MSDKTNNCAACRMIANGFTGKGKLTHTCDKGKEPKKPLPEYINKGLTKLKG